MNKFYIGWPISKHAKFRAESLKLIIWSFYFRSWYTVESVSSKATCPEKKVASNSSLWLPDRSRNFCSTTIVPSLRKIISAHLYLHFHDSNIQLYRLCNIALTYRCGVRFLCASWKRDQQWGEDPTNSALDESLSLHLYDTGHLSVLMPN